MTDVIQQAFDADALRRKAIDYRTRVLAGEELSDEELIEALASIRLLRRAAAATGSSKKSSSAAVRPASDLLSLFATKQDKLPNS